MAKKVKLISICWLLTSKCNYNCQFCFKQTSKRELYYNEAEKILKQIAQTQVKKISFSGGEPLLWPGALNLIRKAKTLGLTTMLITNGSLLTKDIVDSLEEHLDWLTLPLDGSNEKVQQLVGRPWGHFSNVVEFLKYLKRSSIKVKINTVVCKQNYNDIKNITKIIKKYNIKRWKIFQFFPIRDEALLNKDKYAISLTQFNNIKNKIAPLFKGSRCYIYFGTNDLLESSYFLVAPDGTVYVSKSGNDYILGDLKRENISQIWDKNKLIDKEKYWDRAKWILNSKIKNDIKHKK